MPKFRPDPFPPPPTECSALDNRALVLILAARARLLAAQLERLSLRFTGVCARELNAIAHEILRADATLRVLMETAKWKDD